MLTCTVVLVIMSTVYIVVEYFTYREVARRNVMVISSVIAANSSAALAFDSPRDARETLGALKANKFVVTAVLYDRDGKVFATYPVRAAGAQSLDRGTPAGFDFRGSFLEGFADVSLKNEKLGTLYIKRNLNDLSQQMRNNALIAFLLIITTLVLAYFLSRYLQRSISQPILDLERTAKNISSNHDYSVRAVKHGEDELGSLTDAFNLMLSRIEAQNGQIIHANEESAKLAAIVESSGDAIIGTSVDLMITSWNHSAERLFGYPAAEMIGEPIAKVISPELYQKTTNLINRQLNGEQVESFETRFATKSNTFLDISLAVSLVIDARGNIIGVSVIARDITVQKSHEKRIIENEEHLRLATDAAELGVYSMNMLTGDLGWDSNCRLMFGIDHLEPVNFEEHFLPRLHPEDVEMIHREIGRPFDPATREHVYSTEYRVTTFQDQQCWIRSMGKIIYDDSGTAVTSVGIMMDITDKKNEEIKKNDFISVVSHELKTPLTSIKSYVQVLLDRAKKDGDSFRINALTRTHIQTNKMTTMIRDFLSLARIEEGKIFLNREEFELVGMLRNVVEESLLLAPNHFISFPKCKDIMVEADKDKIGQVVINLVSNAVKYSPEGSTILINCETMEGKVYITVTDQGIGISSQDQKKLFNRFYRVGDVKTQTVSGFGIGLYISSEILKYHGSKISVVSSPGQGSAFSFALDILEN